MTASYEFVRLVSWVSQPALSHARTSHAVGPRRRCLQFFTPPDDGKTVERQVIDATAVLMLCDQLSEGVLLIDGSDRVVSANDAARAALGLGQALPHLRNVDGLLRESFGLTTTLVPRLRTGESILCRSVTGAPNGVKLTWVRFDADPAPEGIAAALILQDLQLSLNLRRVEDALANTDAKLGDRRSRGGRCPAPLEHAELERFLLREVQRSIRDGQELAVVVLRQSSGVGRGDVLATLSASLREDDRVGGYVCPKGMCEDEGGMLPVLVLPFTPSTGAMALIMRLRPVLVAKGVRGVRFGIAVFRPSRTTSTATPERIAELLLKEALADSQPFGHVEESAMDARTQPFPA